MAGQVVPVEGTSMDRVKASAASKVMALVPPYVVGVLLFGLGACFHALFGYGTGVPWAVMGETVGTMVLTGVTWGVSHQRGDWGRIHTSLTAFLVGMWVTAATVVGATHPVTGYFWLVGGLTIAASWNIRTVIRARAAETGGQDSLSLLFDRHKGKAKLDGASMKTVDANGRKIDAKMALPAGEKTVGDVQKRTEYIEGAMGMPPGTMTVSADPDRADLANVTISDPRVMKNPIPWPGPSRPGASIADPIRPGVWQDLEDVEYVITGHHIQVMGMTGSGKSIGCLWNTMAEIVTRHDVAILAIDTSKGEQTLGPLKTALHRMETDEAGAKALIRKVQAEIKPRTNYLTSKGLVKWKPGCGLTYWVLWIEEAWKLFDAFSSDEMAQFEELMKAIRSAGGTVVYSLQRGDSTQVPTLIKGQVAHWCFGLSSAHDARWGLSEAQDDAGARPELWNSDQPGMAYLHAPGIPKERIAMPLRTFNWAEDTEAIRAHCAAFPAAGKAVDEFTARIAGALAPADGEEAVMSAPVDVPTPDPDPTVQAGLDDPIEDDPGDEEFSFTAASPAKLSPEHARQVLLEQIEMWRDDGRERFATRDMKRVLTRTGWSRAWVQGQLKKLIADGALRYDDEAQEFVIREMATAS